MVTMANTAPIASGYLETAVNEGIMQQGLEDIVSWIKELPSGTARRTIVTTLASDAFAPTEEFCVHTIAGQGGVADDLVNITATGIRDGSWIGLVCNNVITIKNSGNIQTLDGSDLVVSGNMEPYFRWDNTISKWKQINTPDATLRLSRMPGGLPSTAVTISAGTATPTRGFHTLTSETGVTDDLDFISQTNLSQDGTLLLLGATSGHTLNVRHNQSGTGKIITPDGTNLSLTGNRRLLCAKNGSQWDVIAKLGSWVKTIGEGGTNTGSLGVLANGIIVGNGSALAQVTGTALQQFRVNAAGNGVEAFTAAAGSVQTIIKSGDTAKSTDTTLADDPHLAQAVAASTTYSFIMRLFVTGGGTNADLNMQLVGPAGSTISWSGVEPIEPSSNFNVAGSTPATFQLNANARIIEIAGTITTTGTAGTLKLQWAQASSSAQVVTVKRGSSLVLMQ